MFDRLNKFVWFGLCVMILTPVPISQAAATRAISSERIVDALAVVGLRVNPDQIETLTRLDRAAPNATVRVVSVRNGNAATDTTRVKLRCKDNHECLPFYVLVHGLKGADGSDVGQRSAPPLEPSAPQNMVRGGDRATLILQSPDSRMSLPVICLQSGAQGQTIRAASLDRKRLYEVEVVAAGLLKGNR